MPYVDIPDEAVDAESPFTTLLARRFRDNMYHLNNARDAFDQMLDEATGHKHTTGERTFEYTFSDRITIVVSESDRLDFIFGGGAYAEATEVAELTAATYTPAALATHLQEEINREISGSTAGTDVTVSFDSTAGSPTRGLFIFRHTGTTDSPNARKLTLKFGSGVNVARSVANLIGFRASDYIKALGYSSGSGFQNGYTQDEITIDEGGLVPAGGLQSNSCTNAKFADNVITTAKIDTGAIDGTNLATASVTGAKISEVALNSGGTQVITAGSFYDFTVTLSGRGAAITPCFVPGSTASGPFGQPACGDLIVSNIASAGGSDYTVRVTNTTAHTMNGVFVVGF